MAIRIQGVREVEHTADVALRIEAKNFETLLVKAALGMAGILADELPAAKTQTHHLAVEGIDQENLLVEWLSELLYLSEKNHLIFFEFNISFPSRFKIMAAVEGGDVASFKKEIKAVTYHNLSIRQGDNGLETTIVFDI